MTRRPLWKFLLPATWSGVPKEGPQSLMMRPWRHFLKIEPRQRPPLQMLLCSFACLPLSCFVGLDPLQDLTVDKALFNLC
jgi:hypothetical protein